MATFGKPLPTTAGRGMLHLPPVPSQQLQGSRRGRPQSSCSNPDRTIDRVRRTIDSMTLPMKIAQLLTDHTDEPTAHYLDQIPDNRADVIRYRPRDAAELHEHERHTDWKCYS